jgi:hypothetical protein
MTQPKPIDIGNRKQLLFDDLFFASRQGITLNLNPPVDAGEALHADRPWENQGIISFCDLVPDPHAGHIKLYYLAMEKLPEDPARKHNVRHRLCCAVSPDGDRWEKPDLGVCEFEGSTDNNIVMTDEIGGPRHGFHEPGKVVIDENDGPERRYKMLYMGTPHGIFGAFSADGFNWTVGNDGNPVSEAVSDSQNVVLWDDRLNKWVGYFRLWAPTRCICRVETDDFWSWPFLEPKDVVLAADELDARNGAVNGPSFISGERIDNQINGRRYDPDDDPEDFIWCTDNPEHLNGVDFYNQPVTRYPWADRAYLLPFSVLCHAPNLEEVQLAVSRDGIHWERPGDRQAWIRPPIDEHAGYIYCGPGIHRHGHWLDHYYVRMAAWHGSGKPGTYETIQFPPYCGSIHRARLRLDGYISADAGNGGGTFVTPPLVFQGCRLELNVDTGATGSVAVGLAPTEIEGPAWVPQDVKHTVDACDPIVCNSTKRVVTWNGNDDISALAGQPVRMHVQMQNAKLFAFQFMDGENMGSETATA